MRTIGKRYPVGRREYCGTVGDIRHRNVTEVLEQLGFEVKRGNIHANGTDVIAKKDGKTLALEIMNENVSSYINKSRALRTRRNLRGYRYKGLICSHGKMVLDTKPVMKNIPLCRIGFQTLPKHYHNFYKDREQTFKRKIANKKSLKQLKNVVLSLLTKIKFTTPMYIISSVSSFVRSVVSVGCFVRCLDEFVGVDNVTFKDTVADCTVGIHYGIHNRISNY